MFHKLMFNKYSIMIRLELMAGESGSSPSTPTEDKNEPYKLTSVVAGGGVGNGTVVRLTEDESTETGSVSND